MARYAIGVLADVLKDLEKSDPVSSEREMELYLTMKAGEEARELLFRSCAPWAVTIARDFLRRVGMKDPGLVEDIVQTALTGLLRAVDTFDPVTHGTRLTTYSSMVIYREIVKCYDKHSHLIHVPSSVDPDERSDIPANQTMVDCNDYMHSLPSDGYGADPAQIVGDKLDADTLRAMLDDAMTPLTYREREILNMRFKHGMTLEEVGVEFGLSKERIRQIQHRALLQLKVSCEKNKSLAEA